MKIAKALILSVALLLLGHTNAFADAVLSVVTPTAVNVGQTFTVGIYVTGPSVIHSGHTYTSDVTDLDAFQFDLAFNCSVLTSNPTGCQPGASVLNALSVTEGDFLPQGGANPTFFEPGTIDNTAGEISMIGDVGAEGVTGSGTLVNITFQALSPGMTSIAILANNDLQFYDSNFNPIVIDNSVTTSPNKETFPTNQFLSTPITVTPEPPSVQLMLLGGAMALLTFAFSSRKLRVNHTL
ncbi:MAG TPA: cohesin domain-containing protein [Edaphobacter sp.]|nr:cohesin domain-containing protein [Edaphobacter sp.]